MRSMTGYGTGGARCRDGRLAVEIRTVNHRFLDVRLRVPREYAALESAMHERIRRAVARGRVEMAVERVVGPDSSVRVEVDVALARECVAAWRRLKRELRLEGEVNLDALRGRPEIFRLRERTADAVADPQALRRAVGAALRALERERRREGRHLERDMRSRVRRLQRIEAALRRRAASMIRLLRTRLQERVAAVLGSAPVDPRRLVQEVAFMAERSDVTEELVRLRGHLKALERLLRVRKPVGKQMDFLLQEVQRELNTIGSKVADLPAVRLVLDGKAEVEKLREQVQNVE